MNLDDRDAAARREIRELLDQNFLVEAGAGTGKTRALVERVVALVLAGTKVERVVAITFTEKAAAELRDRVRSGLAAGERDAALSEGERACLAEALRSLDRAQISTIHAFCQALLRQFAPELGIDPAFEVQDEVLADRRFEEMWRLRLDDLGTRPAAREAVNRALDLGITTRDIAVLASSLWKQPELAPILKQQPLVASPAVWPDLEGVLGSISSLGLERVTSGDLLRSRLLSLVASIEGLRISGSGRETYLAAMAGQLSQSFGSVGRRENWGGADGVGRARETAQEVVEGLRATLAGLRSEALAAVLRYVVDFVTDDTRLRGREGKLVFDDLILRVRDLLATRPNARRAIRERFDCLLIDEFQDTDPVQVEIALSFATDPATGEVEHGRLFLVGDPKQSIYRFRRADMAIYSKTRAGIEAGAGRLPELGLNRRSRGPIVDWVNAVFAGLIGPGDAPSFQPPYRAIEPVRGGDLDGPAVAWFGDALDKAAREVRQDEAFALARQVRRAVEERWGVEEGRTARQVAFRDIAILVPTRAILLPLERALNDAGVPHRVEGGSLVYGTQEVRDVINCLTAIDDPADEVAIVAAMRSPAYACSDVELVEFKLAGGRFDYLHSDLDGQQGRVADSLRSLRAFHRARRDLSLAALVDGFLWDAGLAEIGILDRGSRNGFRRARFIVEQARSFEAGGPESLRAFVSWLERRAGRAVLDNEGAGLDDDEDAVRVLTVHAAKGLEFPIVFVAGLGVSPANDRRVFGMDRATGEVGVLLGARGRGGEFSLGPVDRINNQEAQHLRAERDRVLYVAATRARDHLVLSLFHKQGAKESAAARLIDAGAREGAVELQGPGPVLLAGPNSLATLVVDDVGPPEEFDAGRLALVDGSKKQRYESATGLTAERSDETEPWARGRGGTHVGRAVHAVLQSVRWDASDGEVEAVAKAQAVAEAIPEEARDVARLVRLALSTEAAARARSARRALREVPFAMPLDGMIVEGFIDVVVESEDGLEIIDWKTDGVTEAQARERLRDYELQAGLYVLGLQAATGRSVKRVTYVFVRPGVELSPGDAQELAARSREAVLRV